MFKKRKLPEVEPVKLKSFGQMRPGVYILIIYFLIALLLAFLIFVFPGLISNKAYVTFNEPVLSSGVYEDGIYLGSGNDGVFRTKSGNHTYTFKYEGYEYGEISVKVKKKVFFSLFSHKPTLITPERTFNEEYEEKCEEAFLRDIVTYSRITSPSSTFHFPPIFETFAQNIILSSKEDISDIWLWGLSHISSKELYEDYLKGVAILKENGVSYSSPEVEELEKILNNLFNDENNSSVSDSSYISERTTSIKDGSFYSYEGGIISLGRNGIKLDFSTIKEAPITVECDSFSIGDGVVTEHDWALFVSENPEWSKDNIDSLISQGLVDENYLKGISLSLYVNSIRPIRNISWYAASSYTEWLSKKTGEHYSLPTETEWTYAALSLNDNDYVTSLIYVDNNATSPIGMMGQLWEFTSTPYVPLSRLSNYNKLIALSDSYDIDDIIVKGGSYALDQDSVDLHSVGIMTRSQCNEFCGFRVVKK